MQQQSWAVRTPTTRRRPLPPRPPVTMSFIFGKKKTPAGNPSSLFCLRFVRFRSRPLWQIGHLLVVPDLEIRRLCFSVPPPGWRWGPKSRGILVFFSFHFSFLLILLGVPSSPTDLPWLITRRSQSDCSRFASSILFPRKNPSFSISCGMNVV